VYHPPERVAVKEESAPRGIGDAIGKRIGTGGGWIAWNIAKAVENGLFMVFIDRQQDRQNDTQ
jgi:hypothetical protein